MALCHNITLPLCHYLTMTLCLLCHYGTGHGGGGRVGTGGAEQAGFLPGHTVANGAVTRCDPRPGARRHSETVRQ